MFCVASADLAAACSSACRRGAQAWSSIRLARSPASRLWPVSDCPRFAHCDASPCLAKDDCAESCFRHSFYSGPLRGIFSNLRRRSILQDVQTLILDGLAVTAELCHEIISDRSFSVKILSLRGSKHLNESQLRGALQFACRNSRPEGAPRLKGVYIFTSPGSQVAASAAPGGTAAASTIGAGWNHKSHRALQLALDDGGQGWYAQKGRMITRMVADDWAATLQACHGIISFDTVLCRGPRHVNSPVYGKYASSVAASQRLLSVATYALDACAACGTAPEGRIVHGESPLSLLPLLAPPSVLSSTLKAATHPQPSGNARPFFVARCAECLRDRYCASCHRWWCESCYQHPSTSMNAAVTEPVMVLDDDGSDTLEQEDGMSKPKVCQDLCDECMSDRLRARLKV